MSFVHVERLECPESCHRTVDLDLPSVQEESNLNNNVINDGDKTQCISTPLASFFRRKSSKNLTVSIQSECPDYSHENISRSEVDVQCPMSKLSGRVSRLPENNENVRIPSLSCFSNNVGHISHIPRTPPTPATYTIPPIINMNKSIDSKLTQCCPHANEDLFGMIKLKENDVCYTSGTIEWVGRKRSFPINSGFKILDHKNEPCIKKVKKLNKSTCGVNNVHENECSCPDVLPTVNAIVDHLNALHEAVDLVDLRLTTVEDDMCKG